MTPLFQKIILFSLLPVITMIAGGVFAAILKPTGNVRSLILHFAGGVVFCVVGGEILTDIVKKNAPLQLIIGFTLGFLTMIGVRKLTEGNENKTAGIDKNEIPFSLLIAIAVDIFIDGLLLGIGFTAGNTEGILLAIALSLELLSLGMATATELGENNISKKKSIITISILSMVFFISAVLGATLLHTLSHKALEIVFSFGLSALLFLVTEELLTEAHQEKETVWHSTVFFGGFLLFVILGMYS
jgi:ZIP family zinc transporter